MSLVSIISPVYNSEAFLQSFVGSVLAQTMEDWELILVDDGSKDSSLDICRTYEAEDRRIKVIHKDNGGVSSARNAGIEASEGKYILFADSDDRLMPTALKTMTDKIAGFPSLIANYNTLLESGEVFNSERENSDVILSADEQVELFFSVIDKKFQGYVWNRLFRSDIIRKHNIRFNEKIFYKEDGLFVIEYLCASKESVPYIQDTTYTYVEHSSSAMARRLESFDAKILTNLTSRAIILEILKKNGFSSKSIRTAKDYLAHGVRIILSRLVKEKVFNLSYFSYLVKLILKYNLYLGIFKKV